jgi:hypothetical protein
MTEHEASRTLVKSPPELWAECSDADSLARHLSPSFGEIKITRLEPETAIAWEGDRASGTVRIEPSGWGTRVTLTAQTEAEAAVTGAPEPEPAPEPVAEVQAPEPVAEPEPVVEPKPVVEEPAAEEPPAEEPAARRAGLFARLRTRFKPEPVAVVPKPEATPEPVAPVPEPEPAPEPVAVEPEPTAEEPEPEPAVEEPEVDASEILVAALDSLGQAHHRPYSRS